MARCEIQESKRKARRSINCMLLVYMMICGIDFEDFRQGNLGKCVNELR